MAGDGKDGGVYILLCFIAVCSHPMEEPISTNQKQQENNRGVLLSITEDFVKFKKIA